MEIPVQNTSKSRRVFKMRGRNSTLKGRPTKDFPKSSSKDKDGNVRHTLPKQKTHKKRRMHSLAGIVKTNVPSDKKH